MRSETGSNKAEETLRDALGRVSRSDTDQRDIRRASAQDKLARLKARLKNLLMFTGGDPKSIARQAAQIAKEIASAAKEYAAAGGQGPSAVPVAATGQPATPAGAETSEAPAVEAPPPEVKTADAAATAAQAKAVEQGLATSATSPATPAGEPKDPFMEEAKGLAKLAKQIIERAIRRAKLDELSDTELDALFGKAMDAEREVGDASRELSAASPASYAVGAGGGAVAVAVAAGTPSISVRA